MAKIQILEDKKREGATLFERFDIADYANKTFGMYGGTEETVTLLFENSLIGVVMDRFGREAPVRRRDDAHFSVRVRVAVSGQFFGWLTGLGGGARILAPDDVREAYLSHLRKTLAGYEGNTDCQ